MMSTYYSTVKEDPETKELIIELPEELLSKMNWSEDTNLEWFIDENNNVYLSEVT